MHRSLEVGGEGGEEKLLSLASVARHLWKQSFHIGLSNPISIDFLVRMCQRCRSTGFVVQLHPALHLCIYYTFVWKVVFLGCFNICTWEVFLGEMVNRMRTQKQERGRERKKERQRERDREYVHVRAVYARYHVDPIAKFCAMHKCTVLHTPQVHDLPVDCARLQALPREFTDNPHSVLANTAPYKHPQEFTVVLERHAGSFAVPTHPRVFTVTDFYFKPGK